MPTYLRGGGEDFEGRIVDRDNFKLLGENLKRIVVTVIHSVVDLKCEVTQGVACKCNDVMLDSGGLNNSCTLQISELGGLGGSG